MDEREAAVHFYEMLTGVFNDDQSKIIRYVCFTVLALGMLWAGFNYFRASLLADTNTPLDPDMFQDTRMPSNESAIQRIVDLAQSVSSMRRASTTIAATIEGIHNMPFNLDPVENMLDPFSVPDTNLNTAPSTHDAPKAGPLTVKMIMTTDDGQRIAVVDAGGEKAVILRRGDRLPDDSGFVSVIRPSGITVIVNKQEVKYEVPEIPMYQKIRGPKKKSR